MFEIKHYAKAHNIPIMRDNTVSELIRCIDAVRPFKILEIGTAIGYSGIIMLENAKSALLTTIEIDEERAKIAKDNFIKWGLSERADIMVGDAEEIVPCLRVKYDFILLDGPKGSYYGMLPYLIELLNVGGMLFADNVLYMGLVKGDGEVGHKHRTIVGNMRRFLDAMMNNKELITEIIEIDDGIITGRKVND